MMIGAVSEGTLKSRDLLNAFYELLEQHASTDEERELLERINSALADSNTDEDALSELLEDMLDILNLYAPPFTYVGGHMDDPACYGVWVDWDALEHTIDVLKVEDLSQVPSSYNGLVLCTTKDGGTLCDVRNGIVVERFWDV